MKLRYVPMLAIFLVGCGGDKPAAPVASLDKAKFLATAEPPGAKGVIDVRQEAKDGAEVVVVGRIGGHGKTPFTGRAAFTIVDPSLKSCDELGEQCPTPWDFCCDDKDTMARSTLMVRLTDDNGRTLPGEAKAGLGVKELDTVVVKGKIVKSADGELSVIASQLFVRPKK